MVIFVLIMDIIHLLPDSLANQIAAGEVVQRPSSVVKELLENSIDASSNQIELIIKDAGKTLIQVLDNGKGMSITDARMSFERHATSKIKTTDDLFAIKSMGFRGEALASIAAVAQVELKTKNDDSELGTHISVEGSELKFQEMISLNKGTNIQVKNLFFNVPARRNFLKSNAVEMKHILEEFQRISISRPDIGFKLIHNESEIYNLSPSNLAKRLVDVHSKNLRNQLAECSEKTDYVSIQGYIGKPELAKKTRGEQYFFVNNRYIKSPYLNHAILKAFEGTIPSGVHPFYALFIEIDPSHIDINIHPTKTEIKFDNERAVYAILGAAVKKAMGLHNLGHSIDFDTNINFGDFGSKPKPITEPKRFASISNKQAIDTFEQFRNIPEPETRIIGSKINRIEEIEEPKKQISVLQIHNQFIIAQVKSGLMIIDQKLALERIFYEKFYKNLKLKNGSSQQLLFPKTVTFNALDFHLFTELSEELHTVGFILEEFGKNTIKIMGVPAILSEANEEELLKEIIDQFRQNDFEIKVNHAENLSKTLAKRASIQKLKPLAKEEINELINQLFETETPGIGLKGEPIMKIMSHNDLHELISKTNS